MKALFLPDDVGQGHAIRCRALAEALEKRGHRVFTVGMLDEIPRDHMFHVAIIDRRSYVPPIPGIAKTVRIVDEYDSISACDMSVLGSAMRGISEVGFRYTLIGPMYSLLREEFRAERRVIRSREGILDVRAISGWTPATLAEMMGCARVVITYGGMRAMEAACVGTPSVVVHRNRGEKLNADGLAEVGAAVVAAESQAERMADTLFKSPLEVRQRMSTVAMELVDGRGCERVADAIEGLFR